MSDYVTIKEACELTGKSDKTIRRNIIDVQESLNKGRQVKIVSRQGVKYFILKSYLKDTYGVEESLDMSRQVTKKNPKKAKKKDGYLDKYIDKLESENTDLKGVVNNLLDINKELTRQNDQSQRMIMQLQQTQSKLLIGKREEKENIVEEKDSSVWWIIVSAGVFILLGFLVFRYLLV